MRLVQVGRRGFEVIQAAVAEHKPRSHSGNRDTCFTLPESARKSQGFSNVYSVWRGV